MDDTFTLLFRGVPVETVTEAVESLGDVPVTVTIHENPDYVDDAGLPLTSYDIAVALVGTPQNELATGKRIQATLPDADSLLLRNMQVAI